MFQPFISRGVTVSPVLSFPQVTGDAGGFPEALHESFFFMEDRLVANDELGGRWFFENF